MSIECLDKLLYVGQSENKLKKWQINFLCTYKFYGPMHNFFRQIFFIMRGIGPWNSDFFGAREIAQAIVESRVPNPPSNEK